MRRPARQLHYTSCRRGQGGGRGFQTRTLTPGIRPDEQREVESRSGYSAPRDLPFEPTPDEIGSRFPVAFRYYRLDAGGSALTRVQYAGQDYSGRWGNFFAHSLLVADGSLPAWPIDYYEWPGWQGGLAAAADTDDPPAALPEVDVAAIEPSASFALAELQQFLRESPERVDVLAAMIRAVFFGQPRSRMLVVRDQALNGLFWLACIQKSFPLRHASRLSLSTFQFDGRDCAALNATTAGTDFNFGETERGFQFCMFDRLDGLNSEIPDEAQEYAGILARWMADDPGRIAAFHGFMADIDHDEIGPELLHPLRLFCAQFPDAPPIDIPQLLQAVEFAAARLPASAKAGLADPVARVVAQVAAGGTAPQLRAMWRLLVDSLAGSTSDADQTRIGETWIDCLVAICQSRHWTVLPALAEIRQEIAAIAPAAEMWIADYLIADGGVAAIARIIGGLPPGSGDAIGGLLGQVLAAASSTGADPAWDAVGVGVVIDAARPSACSDAAVAQALLRSFDGQAQGIAAACAMLLTPPATPGAQAGAVLGQAIFHLLRSAPASAGAVRRALDTPDTWPVLLGEWQAVLAERGASLEVYGDYAGRVLPDLPGFARAFRDEIACGHMMALAPAVQADQALQWAATGEIDHFSDALRSRCLTIAANGLSFVCDGAGGRRAAEALVDATARYGVILAPDRAWLRRLLERLSDRELPDIRPLPGKLRQLTVDDYGAFLRVFLRLALLRVGADQATHALCDAASVPERQAIFVDAYVAVLDETGKSRALPLAALAAVLPVWLNHAHGAGHAGTDRRATSARRILDTLVGRLATLPRRDFDDLCRIVEKRYLGDAAIKAGWADLMQDVARRNRSIWTRLIDRLRPAGPVPRPPRPNS